MKLLSQDELDRLLPAETHAFCGPVPTQIVSSDEYFPTPQTRQQRAVEARRRLEIPEDMQKQYGFMPLGPADGPIKNSIFGENVSRLYGYNRRAELAEPDRLVAMKAEYGSGLVHPGRPVHHRRPRVRSGHDALLS
jgi:hypothetical protein